MYGSILTTATLNASLISETSQKFNRLFETSSCLSATASKQTIQNVVKATHQDSITFHYSPLTLTPFHYSPYLFNVKCIYLYNA